MKKATLLVNIILVAVILPAQNIDSLMAVDRNPATADAERFRAKLELSDLLRIEYLDSAMDYGLWCVQYADRNGDLNATMSAYHNMGGIYLDLGDNTRALDAYVTALKAAESLGDIRQQSGLTCNIGIVYQCKGDYDDAISNFRKALPMAKMVDASDYVSNIYFSIASAYCCKGERDSCLYYYKIAERIYANEEDTSGLATIYNNIGILYIDSAVYDTALYYMRISLDYNSRIGNDVNIAMNYNNLGDIFIGLEEADTALSYFKKGMTHGIASSAADLVRDSYVGMSAAFAKMNKMDSAYIYLERAMIINDSLFSSDSEQRFADIKAGFDRDAKEKELKIQALETEKAQNAKSVFRALLIVSIIVVGLIVVVFMNRYKIKQKANVQLALKNAEIEEKNKNITDSINYAKRIQQAMLPEIGILEKEFEQSLIFFRPKDIVSGDFYWFAQTNDYFFWATVDCTGHGVPGGFMSVLGASLLNEIIVEKKIYETGEILDLMRVKIILALKQRGESGENKDGMDMVLCRVNKDKTSLQFSGANNPLWLLRNGKITEYKGDKQPVGIGLENPSQFAQYTIDLKSNDRVYTLTDGFADQFGGDKGKKFKYRLLREWLEENSSLIMTEQQMRLDHVFDRWKGNLEQVDDVLIVGVKI